MPAILYVWLFSFRHRLDPEDQPAHVVEEMRRNDVVLHDCPVTNLATRFKASLQGDISNPYHATARPPDRHPTILPRPAPHFSRAGGGLRFV